MSLLAALLAAGDPVDWGSLVGPIYSTGVVGLFALALVFERGIVTAGSMKRQKEQYEQLLLAQAEQYDEQLEDKDGVIAALRAEIVEHRASALELQRVTNERTIPALVHATDAVRAYVAELAKRGGTLG